MSSSDYCINHLDYTGQVCPGCSLDVDQYGNTEDSFENCSFPDCGCDGARLCMAGEASAAACNYNVEGMHSGGRAGLAFYRYLLDKEEKLACPECSEGPGKCRCKGGGGDA